MRVRVVSIRLVGVYSKPRLSPFFVTGLSHGKLNFTMASQTRASAGRLSNPAGRVAAALLLGVVFSAVTKRPAAVVAFV